MRKLVVIGSSNTDMIIQVPHLPGPGETVLGGTFTTAAGGKGANQAVAAARAGGSVSFIAAVGDDHFGQEALAGFAKDNIDTGLCMIDPITPSGVAQIFVDAKGENTIGVAPGANAALEPGHIDRAAGLFGPDTVVLLQLETPLETVGYAAKLAHDNGSTVILNPAPAAELDDELFQYVDYLTPNTTEAELLTGMQVIDDTSASIAAELLLARGLDNVLITRAALGVYAAWRDEADAIRTATYPAFEVIAKDTTAAGDVFNGCLAVALSQEQNLEQAIRFAQAGAALSVQTLGAQTSAPSLDAIQSVMNANA